MKRQLSTEELKVFDRCLSSLIKFIPWNFPMVKRSVLLEYEGVAYLKFLKEDKESLKDAYFCYDFNRCCCWSTSSYYRKYLSGAEGAIRLSLVKISSLPYKIKTINFSTSGLPFKKGSICESKSEKGSYDIELW